MMVGGDDKERDGSASACQSLFSFTQKNMQAQNSLSSPLLLAQGLGKRFAGALVVDSLELTLRRGELLFLAGRNGVGKSTLLKLLAGLSRPSSGEVKREGTLGYLADKPLLYRHLTAEENLHFFARLWGLESPREQAQEALQALGLWKHRHLLVRFLSLGYTKRLDLARVFLSAPDIFLLDEPFLGLDKTSCALLEDMLQAKMAAGCGLVLVTHQGLLEGGIVSSGMLLLGKNGSKSYKPSPFGLLYEKMMQTLALEEEKLEKKR